MASPKTSLKLLVDKTGQRVLFAEATKEFIDFLFHIFSLPMGTLIELLGSNQMVGCLGKLKDSVESLNEAYLQPGIKKDDIFNPKTPYNRNAFLFSNVPSVFQSAVPKPICRCSSASDRSSLSDSSHPFGGNSSVPAFGGNSSLRVSGFGGNSSLPFGGNSSRPGFGGNSSIGALFSNKKEAVDLEKKVIGSYVKEVVNYMVTDDLVVTPMSTISSINIMSNLGVKDLSQLEEKMVSFGKDEALKLLKASLTTENVLTTVFLQNDHP